MAEREAPREKLPSSSLQSINLKTLKTKASLKKTPFQLHKEEKERKRKVGLTVSTFSKAEREEEEAQALLGDFVASFEEKRTAQTFIKAGIQGGDRKMTETTREEYTMDGLKVGRVR